MSIDPQKTYDDKPQSKNIWDQISKLTKVTAKKGFFMFQLLLAAGSMFAISWWGYTQVMKHVLGRFEPFGDTSVQITDLHGVLATPSVILVDPVRTEEFFRHDGDTIIWPYIERRDDWPLADTLWYATEMEEEEDDVEAWDIMARKELDEHVRLIVDYWKDVMFQHEIPYKTIKEPGLTDISFGKYNLLVLPATLLLSEEEKRGIKEFVSYGGGVIMIWYPGIRDENGRWKGSEFLEQITGALVSRPVKDSTGGTGMILKGNSPLTASIPPGTHLEFYTYNGYVTLDIVEPRTKSDAFWFAPYWKGKSYGSESLITHGSYVEGRFVWISTVPESVQEHKDSYEVMDKVVTNAIAWASGRPVIGFNYWPEGYQAGASILFEAKGRKSDLYNFIADANNYGIVPDLIVERNAFPPKFKTDALKVGDFVLSTGYPPQLAGLSMKDQLTWIEFHKERLQQQIGKEAIGLFPIDWNYDEATLTAAARSDIQYILANPNPRFYGPSKRYVRAGAWWTFASKELLSTCPKVQVSAQEWMEHAGIRGKKALMNALERDMKRVYLAGGMYIGIFNPEMLQPKGLSSLPTLLHTKLDSAGFWYTSTSNLMNRFGACQDIRVASEPVTESRLRVTLTNEGKKVIKNVTFQVFLSSEYEEVNVVSQVVGMSVEKVNWAREKGVCYFTVPELKPRTNLAVFLDVSSELEETLETPSFFRRLFNLKLLQNLGKDK